MQNLNYNRKRDGSCGLFFNNNGNKIILQALVNISLLTTKSIPAAKMNEK